MPRTIPTLHTGSRLTSPIWPIRVSRRLLCWPHKLILLGTIAFAVAGCTSRGSDDLVYNGRGLTVISELRYHLSESGDQPTRSIKLRTHGFAVDEEVLSQRLFPQSHPCHSHAWRISDVRVLQDGSVLALFRRSDNSCGGSQLVRLSTDNIRLTALRIDVPALLGLQPSDVELSGQFGNPYATPMYTYADEQTELEAQKSYEPVWTTLQVQLTHLEPGANSTSLQLRTIAIDRRDAQLYDLGPGALIRFEGTIPVALISADRRNDTRQPRIHFKAIAVPSRKTLGHADIRLACYRIGEDAARSLTQTAFPREKPEPEIVATRQETVADGARRLEQEPNGFARSAEPFPTPDDVPIDASPAERATSEALLSGNTPSQAMRRIHDSVVADIVQGKETRITWVPESEQLDIYISDALTRQDPCAPR